MGEQLTKAELQTLEWWSSREIANYLDVSQSTVERWFNNGTLLGKKCGRKWRATTEAVYAFVKDGLPARKAPEPQAENSDAFAGVPNYD